MEVNIAKADRGQPFPLNVSVGLILSPSNKVQEEWLTFCRADFVTFKQGSGGMIDFLSGVCWYRRNGCLSVGLISLPSNKVNDQDGCLNNS